MDHLAEGSQVKKSLDVLDEVRQLFRGVLLAEDKACFDATMQHIPQFVVTGAQSAGKSSVLSRISGVKLPSRAGRCTCVAINLKLRHCLDPADTRTSVELKRPGHLKTMNFSVGNGTDDEVTQAISRAQQQALSDSTPALFAEGHTVDVCVNGTHLPNVTLVDLPGFTNSSVADTELVKRIVGKYLEMDSTLVLHVARGDSDYQALLGNDVVREYSHKITNVFTHCDQLAAGANATGLLNVILRATKGRPVFAVLGEFQGQSESEEKDELLIRGAFAGLESSFRFGATKLGMYLEETMANQMRDNLPATIKTLKTLIQASETDLELIKEQPPSQVLLWVNRLVQERLKGSRLEFRNELKSMTKQLTMEIKSLGMSCLKVEGAKPNRALLAWEREKGLEKGTKVFVDGNVQAEVEGFSDFTYQVKIGDRIESMPSNRLFLGEPAGEVMAQDIAKLLDISRGLRSNGDEDILFPLETYSKDFAKRYVVVLDHFLEQFAQLTEKRLHTVFHPEGMPEFGTGLVRELLTRALAGLETLKCELAAWNKDVEAWNKPPLVFTNGEAERDALLTALVKREGKTDYEHSNVYFKIQSYIMIQRKLVAEAASKQFVLVFNNKMEDKVNKGLEDDDVGELLELVISPPGLKHKRVQLTNRIEVLQQGVTKLQQMFD
ncbi:hypothetical protein BASA81_004001 [Batrachochytrium salamandrivorans]|nr:hypothetical protein BASA81_004001 [Batrachochytrium salamandrivorans]